MNLYLLGRVAWIGKPPPKVGRVEARVGRRAVEEGRFGEQVRALGGGSQVQDEPFGEGIDRSEGS